MSDRGAGKRRFSSVVLALFVALVLGGIVAPILISLGSDGQTGGSNLVAAPRDSLIVTTATNFGASRSVTLERGFLYPADARGRALERPLSRAELAAGRTRIVIENGNLRLMDGAVGDIQSGEVASPMLEAIASLGFEAVLLRKSTVTVMLPDGRSEVVSDVEAEITHRRKASLAIKGTGELRGQRITFDATAGIGGDQRPGSTMPLKISLKSGLVELTFDGRSGRTGASQLVGAIDFKVPHIRQIARWFGTPWPTGYGLRNLAGSAQLEWTGPSLALNKTTIVLDGNAATGTMHLNFTGPRPSVGGTLALNALDLGRYYPSQTATSPRAPSVWTNLLMTDLSVPLAQHFDADLRISADKVVLGNLTLGRSAAAITVSQARMLADVGTFEFDGGRGSGQFSVDMTGSIPKLTVRGRVEEIDASRLTSSLFGHSLLTGRATIRTDVSSFGRTGDDLLVSSNGKLHIDIRNGGRIGLDLRTLAAAALKRPADGWGQAGRGTTTFDDFSGNFIVRSGALIAEDVKAETTENVTILTGQIDVPTNRINASIVQLPAPLETQKPQRASVPGLSLQLFGPWAQPTIRNEFGRERAAEPSVSADPARL